MSDGISPNVGCADSNEGASTAAHAPDTSSAMNAMQMAVEYRLIVLLQCKHIHGTRPPMSQSTYRRSAAGCKTFADPQQNGAQVIFMLYVSKARHITAAPFRRRIQDDSL